MKKLILVLSVFSVFLLAACQNQVNTDCDSGDEDICLIESGNLN